MASLALNVSATAAGVLTHVILFFVPNTQVLVLFGLLPAFLMTFVAWCLFMGFLRQLCLHLGEEPLGEEAVAVMLRGIFLLVGGPFVLVSALTLVFALRVVGVVLLLLLIWPFSLYVIFVFLRRQLDLIGSIRQVIATRF